MKVGFIGVGVIGEHMCRNIMKAGHDMAIHDINPEPVKRLAAEGAKPKQSPAEVARAAEVIVTMLPNSPHVQSVILGESGLLQGLQRGTVVIDMSTISPRVSVEIAQKVREAGGAMIDAPVVKSVPAAISGDLGILVGGPEEVYEKMLPILKCMGKNIIRMGENGKGLTMKLCHNMCAAIISEAVSEMIVLGLKNGLQFDDILKAVSYGGAQNFYLDSKAARLKAGEFSVQFPLEHMVKDLGLVMDLADSSGVSLPAGSAVKQIYGAAAARGMKREDFSAILKVVKMLAGME